MSDTGSVRIQRGFLFRLLLAITLLMVFNSVVDTIISSSLLPFFMNGQTSVSGFWAYSLILDLFSLGYLVLYLLIFYMMGLKSDFLLNRDWFALLEYLFLGGLLGSILGFLARWGVSIAFYGAISGSGSFESIAIASTLFVLGFVQNAGEQALLAFAALVVGTILRPSAQSETAVGV